MYKVTANSKFNFDIESTHNSYKVGNSSLDIDLHAINENNFHILLDNKSFLANVVELNKPEKYCIIKVNGNQYRLDIKDQFDALLHQLGMDNLAANKINEVKAPMPGLVLKVLVKDGDVIKKGDSLFVLEAMKMENIIKSPADATVKAIKVEQGQKVEKNQAIILFS